MTEYLCVPQDRVGLELDEFLCLHFPELTKGRVRALIREGRALLDGELSRPNKRLTREQVVIVDLDEEDMMPSAIPPEAELEVLYEDERVLVVNKPAGIASEPERWAREKASVAGGLVQLARERTEDDAQNAPLEFRPRLLHRLDKDTSGALAVAKDLETERCLRHAFEVGEVHKTYLAIVEGEYPETDGEGELIDLPLESDARRSGRMRVARKGGKPSQTRVAAERRFRGFTAMRCHPLTGRTHQIRVHLAHQGFPLVVDPLYGRNEAFLLSSIKSGYKHKRGHAERPLIGRLSLHAWRIELPAVVLDASPVQVEAPLPRDFAALLRQLEKVRPAQ